MTHSKSIEDLEQAIEGLAQEHIAASRDAARGAIERAFATAGVPARAAGSPPRGAKRPQRKKRGSSDIVQLGERFFDALTAKPGETMKVLAADLGVSARDLHRPVSLLRRAGRVRTVGERHLMRYFPMADETATTA